MTRTIERGSDGAATDELTRALRELANTVTRRATSSVTGRVDATTRRLNEFAASDTPAQRKEMSSMKTKVTTKLSDAGSKLKAAVPRQRGSETTPEPPDDEPRPDRAKDIVASVDVGVSPDTAYRAWADDPDVEIVDETPGERILWRDDRNATEGAITFHELAPTLTRVMLVVEHHPHGLAGRVTGRTRGRAARRAGNCASSSGG
ncbi:MAG: hypothetical protein GEV04_04420 [Actinophytocola sp.]|nr:hypothetical protein [Actinophytocola sp.]